MENDALNAKIEKVKVMATALYNEGRLTYKASVLGTGIADPLKKGIKIRDDLLELLNLKSLDLKADNEKDLLGDLEKVFRILVAIRKFSK